MKCCDGRCHYRLRAPESGWCGCNCDDCIRRMIRSAYLTGLLIDSQAVAADHDRRRRLR